MDMEFVEPLPDPFVMAGWSVDLRRVGPFVRASRRREQVLEQLRQVRGLLEEGGCRARLLETTFLPPLPGAPRLDVVLLVDGPDASPSMVARHVGEAGAPAPVSLVPARNVLRFGDTDTAGSTANAGRAPVLLNHFVGSCTPQQAAQAWGRVSDWYRSVLGVDNSTLLQPVPGAGSPYLDINYAVVPGPVPRFMLAQLTRPSFYRSVIAPLQGIGARACPLFARRIA